MNRRKSKCNILTSYSFKLYSFAPYCMVHWIIWKRDMTKLLEDELQFDSEYKKPLIICMFFRNYSNEKSLNGRGLTRQIVAGVTKPNHRRVLSIRLQWTHVWFILLSAWNLTRFELAKQKIPELCSVEILLNWYAQRCKHKIFRSYLKSSQRIQRTERCTYDATTTISVGHVFVQQSAWMKRRQLS